MTSSLIDRLAFALQDETMTRLQARRYVASALAAIEPGDVVGPGLVVVRKRPVVRRSPANGAGVRSLDRSPSIDFEASRGEFGFGSCSGSGWSRRARVNG